MDHVNQSSPLAKSLRQRKKQLTFGPDAACELCGETELRVLQQTISIRCAECRLAAAGKPTTERHHPAGRHNDDFAALLPANPHAVLSDAQYDWPRETLRNPDRDPLRTLAAWLRFFADTFRYLSEVAHTWATDLETYAIYLSKTAGPQWWVAAK
jgi:hypothetical protein